MTRYGSGRLPDFLLMGAPKAGTSALHAALAAHPQLFLSRVKEPKYYLCGDSPPPAYQGPGDAHSNREWVWQRSRYRALFAEAGDGVLCGESTPFYLYHRDARRRIAADLPRVRLVAVLRDPERIDAGWAPFWHRRGLGSYGRQVADLYRHVDPERVPPEVWRKLSKPLVAQLHGSGHPTRPKLTAEQRSALLEPFLPDIDLLEQVTGEDFGTWREHRDGATFQDRRAVRA